VYTPLLRSALPSNIPIFEAFAEGLFVIQADKITFHKEKMQAVASGNVKIVDPDIFVSSDYVSYDVQENLIHAENSKLKVGERYFFIKGLDIVKSLDRGI
jgi:lipopolysaccharide assembly outer membrane protein LptD (OstA)